MCYSVYLSTDSPRDLAAANSEYLRFEKENLEDRLVELLNYDNRWHVGSKSGCGCTFRHLSSVELGFGEPVEWYEEEEDEIAATMSFIRVVRRIAQEGHGVDCVDAWHGVTAGSIEEKTVNLAEIRDEEFRFFENYHFRFVAD